MSGETSSVMLPAPTFVSRDNGAINSQESVEGELAARWLAERLKGERT